MVVTVKFTRRELTVHELNLALTRQRKDKTDKKTDKKE